MKEKFAFAKTNVVKFYFYIISLSSYVFRLVSSILGSSFYRGRTFVQLLIHDDSSLKDNKIHVKPASFGFCYT